MNPSRTVFVVRLRRLLSNTPFYRPLRHLYNRLFLLRARRTVTLKDISITFLTPTFKIIDDVEEFAEKHLLLELLDSMRVNDTVWDIGANIGLYTLFASHNLAPTGRVVAFEPEPSTRALLQRNVTLNKSRNVTVLGYALDDTNSTKTLFRSASPNPGTHSLVRRTDYKLSRKGKPVQAMRGDTLVHDLGMNPPNVVKIDVEGAEFNVLRGMGELLRAGSFRMLIVEVHPEVLPLFGTSASTVEQLIRSSQFSKITRVQRGAEYHLVCRRN